MAKKLPKEKKSKNPSVANKVDFSEFNLLENLLVFCLMKERSVDPENGIHFRISPRDTDKSICLLFKPDRDDLFEQKKKRPDYMVLHATSGLCLITIIEMKGGKDVSDAIRQIKELRDKLNTEIRANLPKKFKVKFQAIILHSKISQTPNNQILKESTDEFVIRPVRITQKAELFDYISQKFTSTEPKINTQEQIKNTRQDLFVESVMCQNAQPKRKIDKFCKSNKHIANNRDGIYINYALPKDNYAALAIDTNKMKIAVEKPEKQIQTSLQSIGLKSPNHFEIEHIN